MRFLLLPMRFPIEPGRSYLTTELAEALVEEGHEVEVLLLDWSAPPGGPSERRAGMGGIPVIRVCPRAIGRPGSLAHKISKFALSARHVGREARQHLTMAEFDAIIGWMPAIAFAPVLGDAVRVGVGHRLLFVWDFFPDHHAEIGLVPRGPVRWLARRFEQHALRRFDTIFCTLPANGSQLRRRFRLAPGQRIKLAPVWTPVRPPPQVNRRDLRARHALPQDVPIAVFGGQLVAGRGFDQMLKAAEESERLGSSLVFLFVGDGPLADRLAREASTRRNVFHMPAMSSDTYRELLGACDVGMVATVPGVTSHAMPSKTLDYLGAGLPVIAALEPGSEFARLLEQRGVGRAVAFGDAPAFATEAAYLASDSDFRAGLAERTYSCLADIFDVRLAASAVLAAAGERHERNSSATKPAPNTACVAK